MIAALGMYDRPETAAANDRFWAGVRDGLRARAIPAPQTLTRGEAAYWPAWTAPDLVLSQTCGLPYRARLHGRVTLVATPDHRLPGCPAGHYRSVIVVRADDPRGVAQFQEARLAHNEALSQSGWAAACEFAAAQGLRLRPGKATGSHRASALAVAEGRADLAAIDAVTFTLLSRWEPAMAGLRVLAETAPRPALPYVSARGADGAAIAAALEDAVAGLDAADRALLCLHGIVRVPADDYLAVPMPPEAPPETLAE